MEGKRYGMKSGAIDKAVFLDFDGVLFDTVKEAYCIAMLASGRAKSVDDIDFDSEHYGKFKESRFLITAAPDYYYLLKAIDKKTDIEDVYRQSVGSDAEGEKKFSQRYFDKRNSIKAGERDFWLSLNTPYDFLRFIKGIITRRPEVFFIVTTKDKGTVADLLKIQKVRFRKENIFGLGAAEAFRSKGEAISFVREQHAVKRGLYIDDSEYHLSCSSGIDGIETICAGWGYVSGTANAVSAGEALAKIKKFLGD